jgi:predicted outer membrane repeat protein
MENRIMKNTISQNLTLALFIAVVSSAAISLGSEGVLPIADAGSSRYAAQDAVFLDGTGSYDPGNSNSLSYTWRQISGLTVVISDADTAAPTISGFVQTEEIKECEFELVVSDGELTSLPDTVKVIIVPDFGTDTLRQENPPFDRNKPTLIHFGGGDCISEPDGFWGLWSNTAWFEKANVISFNTYVPDRSGIPRTYYRYGDRIIVYLSSLAPDYKQPIQVSGWSTGGQPAIDTGIRLNRIYADARYAVNHVTFLDASPYCRDYSESIPAFLGSSVDGEQCWADAYVSTTVRPGWAANPPHYEANYPPFYDNVLNVWFPTITGGWWQRHGVAPDWYRNSLKGSDMNQFNNGLVAGAYWSVIGPGKNLQLTSTPDAQTYKFNWNGWSSSGYMDFADETQHPGRLPEPVTLIGPRYNSFVDANGALFSCEVSENAVGYQLLFGPDPYRVMDYYIVSDTPSPPNEIITTFPFKETWWTVKVRDQYGSTIYADPIQVIAENVVLLVLKIENVNLGKGYSSFRHAIDDAHNGHEIVVSPGVYQEKINFKGKNLTLRSTNPTDPAIMAVTIIAGDGNSNLVTFSGGEDANCVLAGFTITGGNRGIYCSGSSPTITNCTVMMNGMADMGAGMYIKDGSSPTLINCTFTDNLASVMGGGMYTENSSPMLINCTFAGNSATYFGGGIYCAGGSLELTNCILWGDTPDEISLFNNTPVITYSDIQGGWADEGNIDTDPLFADPANGNYHLLTGSPCIDAGDPTTPVDLEPLPNGERINMGAYGGTIQASKSP